MEIRIDIDRLREALADCYGTAMMGGMPFAAPDLFEVEGASPEQLVRIAQREGFDLRDFETK